MLDDQRIQFGGIAPTTADVETALPLTAARFTGGALGDRVVVRLVPECLAVAEDGIASSFGVPAAERSHVGFAAHRSIGFPAWVIMQDPGQASNALNVAADLKRIIKVAQAKPGRAKESVDALASRLASSEPNFLPTFYEQAARGFLAADNEKYAAMMFSRAREAERTHNLPIDDDRHLQAFIEFGQAGAVNAKEISAEARSLAKRHQPADAFTQFRSLVTASTEGGLRPYADLSRDFNRLAGDAGKDVVLERRALLVDLLSTDGIEAAQVGFWSDFGNDIQAMLSTNDETSRVLRTRLLQILPRIGVDQWVGLLDAWGLIDTLASEGDPVRWVDKVLPQLRGLLYPRGHRRLTSVLVRLSPRLRGHTFTVDNLGALPLSVLDALYEAGATVRPLHDRHTAWRMGVLGWVRDEHRRDLRFVAADPVLGPRLRSQLVKPDQIEVAVQYEALHPLLVQSAEEAVGWLGHRPLSPTTVEVAVERARVLWPARELIGPQLQTISSIARSSAQLLADALRLGLDAELTWPAGEQAVERTTITRTQAAPHRPHLFDAWPAIGFGTRLGVEFVDGDQVVGRATLNGRDALLSSSMIDDVVGTFTMGTGHHIQWGNGEVITAVTRGKRPLGSPSWPVPGGRQLGTGMLRFDSTEWPFLDASVFSDGQRVWVCPEREDCYEIDPATGRRIRDGLPPWLAAQQERFAAHPNLVLTRHAMFRPVSPSTAHSPISTYGGMHASAVFANTADPRHWVLVAADGSAVEFRATNDIDPPWALVLRPGGGLWVLLTSGRLLDHATGQTLVPSISEGGFQHPLHTAPPAAWYQKHPRDPAASQVLRQMTAQQVQKVLASVQGERHARLELVDVDPRGKAAAAVRQLFGHPVDADLVTAIVFAAHRVRHLGWRVDELQQVPQPMATEVPADTPLARADEASDAASRQLQRSVKQLGQSLAWAAEALGTKPRRTQSAAGPPAPSGSWAELIGREAALLYLAASPAANPSERNAYLAAFDALVAYGYLDHAWTVRVINLDWRPGHVNKMAAPGVLITGVALRHTMVITPRANATGAVGEYSVQDTLQPVGPRDRAALQRLADRIRAGERMPWHPELAEALADRTGLSTDAAAYLLLGAPGRNSVTSGFLTPEASAALGERGKGVLHSRDEVRGRAAVAALPSFAAAVPDDPEALLSDGPDLARFAEQWGGSPNTLKITDEQRKELLTTFPVNRYDNIHPLLFGGLPTQTKESTVRALMREVNWLTHHLPLDDPARPQLADRWQQYLDWVAAAPEDLQRRHQQEAQWAPRARELLLAPPRPGYALDPRVSAPDLVSQVTAQHGLSEDAAVYYLQLLALPHPTDANVRHWNDWKPRTLTAARNELVKAELVVEAKRSRAKRSVFLPGGWDDSAKAPVLPLESWKAGLYEFNRVQNRHLAWRHPVADLFDKAWRRVLDGEPPGYAELETERRRRR